MMTLKVETMQSNTKAWENQITFKPEYVMSVMKMRKHWWWPWSHNEYGVIANLRDAEKAAREKAKNHATALFYKVPARITAVTELNGSKTSEVIWQNGKPLEQTKWPWYRRLWHWLWL